jgi:hypothetical protein
VLVLVGPGRAASETPGEVETATLLRMLEETIDTKDFGNPMALKELMGLLYEKFAAKGKELPILINEAAIKKVGGTAEDWEAKPVRLPVYPKRLSVALVLRIALGQIETFEATYLLRQGGVEILPAKHATPAHLLKCQVQGAFVKTTLEDVLQDLAYQTGASVAIDPRAGEKARAAITATFRNDTTLEAALRMVAEMAELKLVVLPGGLFVTTPEHADKVLKERTALQSASNQ